MKVLLITCALLGLISQINASCSTKLNEKEESCATRLGLDSSSLMKAYIEQIYPDGNKDKFISYVGCLFRAFNFVDSIGNFHYDVIKTTPSLPWFISRDCPDGPHKNAVEKAVDECEKVRPPADNAIDHSSEQIRACIDINYKKYRALDD